MRSTVALEKKTETMVCPLCGQEYSRFKRGSIPNFVFINGSDGYICIQCKKAEPRICPRCGEKKDRFDKKGKSAFHLILKSPGEIEYICTRCKLEADTKTKRKGTGRWA